MIIWLLMSVCQGQAIPSRVEIRADLDLPSLPTIEPSYTFTPEVVPATGNPYIERTTLPTNLVFIIVGGILLLVLVASLTYWLIMWIKSFYNAKFHSEKYYYNSPFQLALGDSSTTTTSSTSSLFEKKSSISNFSQMTLNQPLNPGRPYRNATLDNNRGSMFFSPTNDLLIPNENSKTRSSLDLSRTISGYNNELNSSSLSLIDMSAEFDKLSSYEKLNNSDRLNSYEKLSNFDRLSSYDRLSTYNLELNTDSNNLDNLQERPKMARPPSQYLNDLLDGDDEDD